MRSVRCLPIVPGIYMWMRGGAACLLAALLLIGAAPANAQILINEIMALSTGGFLDEDRDSSDWIELFNASVSPVNLDGWFLTDDSSNLSKWRFPSATIEPGGFLIVFASGKNRAVAGGELHTNFQLDDTGEYLALVRGDGSVADEYAPRYPPQVAGVAYGRAQRAASLVKPGSAGRWLVPSAGDAGSAWKDDILFDDSHWTTGVAGFGFGPDYIGLKVTCYKANITVSNLTVAQSVTSTPARRSSEASEIAPYINYFNTQSLGHFSADRTFPGLIMGQNVDDFVVLVTGSILIPEAGQWTFGVNSDDGFGAELKRGGITYSFSFPNPKGPSDILQTFLLPAPGLYDLRIVYYDRGGGAEFEFFAAKGAFAAFNAAAFHLVGDTANGGLPVFATSDTPALKTAMYGVNASLWSRFPFNVEEPDAYDLLRLKMRYADGFAAYLNGTEVARRNAPATLPWNAAAVADRPVTAGVASEEINIQAYLHALTTGTNILAIQGLNDSPLGEMFRVEPELLAASAYGPLQYLAPPTPGSLNETGTLGLVENVVFSHARGFCSAPFALTLTCPTTDSQIYYTINGSEPTAVTGTTYTAPIQTTGTCMVRAVAFKPGWLSSRMETHTYIFVADVVTQSPTGQRPGPDWPNPGTVNTQIIDYGMDPDVVNNAQYSSLMDDALLAIPALSLVTDQRNLFTTATGIYVNASQDGRAWERPASLELINPDGQPGFQINFGLRIRGGYSRNGNCPKHSFRCFFRSDYGDGHLKYPLFDQEGPSEFEKVDIKTAQNYSWSFDGSQGFLNTMNRDVFSRDKQRDLGDPYTRGRYYHLYLNGQYWGLYYTQERCDSYFAKTYFGGDTGDYDIVKIEREGSYQIIVSDGNLAAYQRLYNAVLPGFTTNTAAYFQLQGLNPDGTRKPSYERQIDPENLADYMMVIYYTGNFDTPISDFLANSKPNNLYAVYNRNNPDGWKFFAHDCEHTLHDATVKSGAGIDRTGLYMTSPTCPVQYFNPQWLHQQLATNAEYRLKFADRVYRAFFNNGPLTPASAISSFMNRANQIQWAIIGESARWGDAKVATPRTKNVDWVTAINRVVNTVLPTRTQVVLNQFIAKGWYPSNAAPVLTPQGGLITRGSAVTMSATSGTIYYTLDGSDPRAIGGAIGASALVYNPTSPPVLLDRTTIKARSRYGSIWSALNEANFEIRINAGDLIITEILADANNDDTNREWFEIFNTTNHAIDINGLAIADNGTDRHTIAASGRLYIASKGYLVLGATTDTALNGGAPVNYGYGADITLGNGGDEVVLLQGSSVIHSVGYEEFSTGTYAIVTQSAAGAHQGAAFGMAENYWSGPVNFWMDQYSSYGTNGDVGTPGRANDAVYVGPGADKAAPNLIEGRFTRADRIALRFDEVLSTPTATLAANYAVVGVGAPLTAVMMDETRVELRFASDFQYDRWYCVNVTGVADRLGNAISGTTSVLVQLTLPALTITELMYNPLGGSAFEFIELYNRGAATVNLEGMVFTDGFTYTIGAGATLDPGQYLLVTPSDSAGNFAAFRAHYGLDASVKIMGPYAGNLSNAGEAVTLKTSSWGVEIFSFEYSDGRGWPPEADGGGHSMIPVAGAQAGVSSESLYYGGNWRASAYINGSPGGPDPEPPVDIMLNEFAAHTDYMAPPYDSNDWIELYNPTTAPITLTNYYLSDDVTSPAKWRIPDGTVVPALGRIVLDEIHDFHNPITEGFGLNKAGEDLALSYLAGGAGDRIVDSVRFKGQENGVTLGRYQEGGGPGGLDGLEATRLWFAMAPTSGTANVAPNADVVISEIMYHGAAADEEEDEDEHEYIELHNPTSSPINLYNATGGWRINGGVNYTFPTTATLP
ncbi:MAG: lamin tail domain-containing protein, partial [Candidatus Sumerlaeota bacterium]|nr:lamin tail domain-containing protein [Candidatus Sumerlaeota bacterium]